MAKEGGVFIRDKDIVNNRKSMYILLRCVASIVMNSGQMGCNPTDRKITHRLF